MDIEIQLLQLLTHQFIFQFPQGITSDLYVGKKEQTCFQVRYYLVWLCTLWEERICVYSV